MERIIFDSHAHYTDDRFSHDSAEILDALPTKGVRYVMCAAVDLADTAKCISLAEKYDFIFASAGIHPHEAQNAPPDFEQIIEDFCRNPNVRAIGEIGLDYHYDFSPRQIQLDIFERQLLLAKKLDLPVIVHDREAHEDTMALLKKYLPKGIVHCFSGSPEMALELVKLGFYIGFTGVITFPNARKTLSALAAVPLNRILLETDCPYMAPVPYRGQRCDSSMIIEIANTAATVKNIPPDEILRLILNAKRVYRID